MEAKKIIDIASARLHALQEDGGGINVTVNNLKPKFLVRNMQPLVYEKFGFGHRAPRLSGRFPLEGFLTQELIQEGIINVYEVLDGKTGLYAVRATAGAINQALELLDVPYSVRESEY